MQYQPTLGIKETAQNIRHYVEATRPVFFDLMKKLAPFLIACTALDMILTIANPPVKNPATGEYSQPPQIGELISTYFITMLVISWHRVVIHGPDHFRFADPLKPNKDELAFLGMGILLGVGVGVFTIAGGLPLLIFGKGGYALGVLIACVIAFYMFYKACFYFPAKAAGSTITLAESFKLTKGYLWKMICASFLASLPTLGMMVAYLLVIIAGAGFLLFNTVGMSPIAIILMTLLSLPIVLYFNPLLTIYGVTALSNYYMHAMQNKFPVNKETRHRDEPQKPDTSKDLKNIQDEEKW